MTTAKSEWPGREVRDPVLRAVAQSAVRQGWRYRDHTLFPPGEGKPVELPQTPQWRAQKRALHALYQQGVETVRPTWDSGPASERRSTTIGPPEDYGASSSGLLERLAAASTVKPDARGDKGWSLAQAREQVRAGYSVDVVAERTGWGRMWLADAASS